jgi:predicted DNA-binding WGR domain protein
VIGLYLHVNNESKSVNKRFKKWKLRRINPGEHLNKFQISLTANWGKVAHTASAAIRDTE